MDLRVIARTRVIFSKELLDVKTSTMLEADTLRAQAKACKMNAGTMRLEQGHQTSRAGRRRPSREIMGKRHRPEYHQVWFKHVVLLGIV